MEAAGIGLRARSFGPLGRKCSRARKHLHASLSVAHRFHRQLHVSASPGAGPAGGSSGDVNENLAPIIFRFTDGNPSPVSNTGGATTSAQGAAWTGVISASGASSSASVMPLDTAVRVSPVPTLTSSPNSVTSSPSSPRPSRDTTGEDAASTRSPDASSSYSDYYRKANTAFSTHSHPTGEQQANGWSLSGPKTSASSPSHSSPSSSPAEEPNSGIATSTADAGRGAVASASSSPADTAAASGNGAAASAESAGDSPAAAATTTSDAAVVSAALARAQAALERAETSLDDIQRLRSSLDDAALESLRQGAPPSRWARLLALARGAAVLGGLSFAMLASHAFGLAVQWAGATLGAAMIAGWGLRRGALAPSGAVAAFVVGCGTLGSSLRFGATLVAFFLSSSKLTAYKEELKEGLEENAKKGGQRSWVQVLCNGLVPTILAVVYGVLAGCVDLPLGPPAAVSAVTTAAAAATGPALEPWRAAVLTGLMGGFLGYYACCCGDTWASELGPLSGDTPRLITTMRPVRRGTNGGVTLLGLSASIMGGMFVGLVFYLAGLLSPTLWIFESQRALAVGQWRLIPLGLMAGLFGSVLDSVLGATLQYSGYDTKTGRIASRPGPDVVRIAGVRLLDNNAVNAVSATLTSALTALAALKTFGF